jgi:hypothetical protein
LRLFARADRAIPNVAFVTTARTGRIVSMNAATELVPAFRRLTERYPGLEAATAAA